MVVHKQYGKSAAGGSADAHDGPAIDETAPDRRSFHNPGTIVAPQFPSILAAPVPIIVTVRHNQIDAGFSEPLPQGDGIAGPICINPLQK